MSGRVGLSFLTTLGVSKQDVSRLREEIHRGEIQRARDQFAVDIYDRVALRTLVGYAKQLNVDLPVDRLEALLQASAGKPLEVPPDPQGFPEALLSAGEPRRHPEQMNDRLLTQRELGSGAALGAFLDALVRSGKLSQKPDLTGEGMSAELLGRLLSENRLLAAQSLSSTEIDQLLLRAHAGRGPAYEEQDTLVRIDSKFQSLLKGEGKADGVEVFKKSMLEGLTLHRGADGKSFSVSAFPVDKIVVALPPGASLFLVNEDGDQAGLRLPVKRMEVDGQPRQAVEISRALVRPSGSNKQNPRFTLKVVEKGGSVLLDQSFQFHSRVALTSQKILSGSLGYPEKPLVGKGELSDLHFDHFVPSPRHNPVPAGERPVLRVGEGPPSDQLLIQRDGETFGVNRWIQFAYPPRGTKQAFDATLGDGRKTTYTLSGANHQSLDDPDYDPRRGARIESSHREPASMDASLSQTDYFSWTFRGATVYSAQGRKAKASFDPLSGDKNLRRK